MGLSSFLTLENALLSSKHTRQIFYPFTAGIVSNFHRHPQNLAGYFHIFVLPKTSLAYYYQA
jgi:hypothetical protein